MAPISSNRTDDRLNRVIREKLVAFCYQSFEFDAVFDADAGVSLLDQSFFLQPRHHSLKSGYR